MVLDPDPSRDYLRNNTYRSDPMYLPLLYKLSTTLSMCIPYLIPWLGG